MIEKCTIEQQQNAVNVDSLSTAEDTKNEIIKLLVGTPCAIAKGILQRAAEEIEWVSKVDEQLLSERHENDARFAANLLK